MPADGEIVTVSGADLGFKGCVTAEEVIVRIQERGLRLLTEGEVEAMLQVSTTERLDEVDQHENP